MQMKPLPIVKNRFMRYASKLPELCVFLLSFGDRRSKKLTSVLRRSFVVGGACALFLGSVARSQTTDLVIKVQLPTNRWQAGLLQLERVTGETLLQDINVYGKADNSRAAAEGNPNRDTTLPYGDTPEGTYSAPRAVATGDGTAYSAYSYGPNGAIVLAPESGDAMAAKENGRVGLLIHGGDLNSQGKLRATHGCLRLSNEDMSKLISAIREAGNNPILQRCEVVDVSVIVGPEGVDEPGSDESDPPPGIEALLSPTSSPLL